MAGIGRVQNLNNIENAAQASQTNISQEVGNIPIVQKQKLTYEQEQEMLLFGFDPANQADIEKYLNLSNDEKLNIQNNAVHHFEEINEDAAENVEQHTEIEHEKEHHVHNFHIDTESSEWKSMNNAQKLQHVLLNGAKSKYTEDEWAALGRDKQAAAVKEFTETELSEHIPEWKNLSEKEKLNKLSDIINYFRMAEANEMSFKELIELSKSSPEQFKEFETKYYSTHEKVNILKDIRQTKRKTETEIYQANFDNYCYENNITIDDNNRAKHEYSYLKTISKDNINDLEKTKLNIYKGYEQIYGSVDDIKTGTQTVDEWLQDSEDVVFDNTGKINWKDNKTRLAFHKKVDELKNSCKNIDEFREKFSQFTLEDQKRILFALGAGEHKGKQGDKWLDEFLTGANGRFAYAVVDGDAPEVLQSWSATTGKKQVYEDLKKNNKPLDGYYAKEAENARIFKAEYAAQSVATSAELNDEHGVSIVNSAISERKDAVDVFAMSNPLIANSNNISDEMKQFYAQNSVEVLKTPEQRQAQADNLGKYKIESFDKGLQKGLENVAVSNDKGLQSSSSSVRSNNNLSSNVQKSYNAFVSTPKDKNGEMSREDAVKMFQKLELNEQKEFLSSLSPQQVQQIPITVCNAFPELIGTFIDLGKGIDIIQKCSVNTGNKTIQIMAKSKGEAKKQFNDWAANHTNRLAKSTYDALVESGDIKIHQNKMFDAKS